MDGITIYQNILFPRLPRYLPRIVEYLSRKMQILIPMILFQFDWVCKDSWKPAFTQSIFYVGAIVGTLGFGWVSDHYGRYTSFIASNSIVLVSGIATPFAFSFESFLIARFVMGLSFMTFFLSMFMLCEFSTEHIHTYRESSHNAHNRLWKK